MAEKGQMDKDVMKEAPVQQEAPKGRVTVDRKGVIGLYAAVALLLFGVFSYVADLVRPAAKEDAEVAFGELLEGIGEELAVPFPDVFAADSVSAVDAEGGKEGEKEKEESHE